ncbi:MAG: hypothetical protein R3F17_16925 [Planctomycetota bacterium]
MPGDTRPLEVQYEIAKACGAWADARKVLARILEIAPGHLQHEQRFRDASAARARLKVLARRLAEVEATGRFVDTRKTPVVPRTSPFARRSSALGTDVDVKAVIFQRGGTALVQGLHGATADRTARAVREVGAGTRSSARRMGIGRAIEVTVEGSFGSLAIAVGNGGTAACWSRTYMKLEHYEALHSIVGAGAQPGGSVA